MLRTAVVLAVATGANALAIGSAPTGAALRSARISMAAPAPEMVKGELKTVTLKNAAGDSATVYPFGACVTSYIKGGVDTLMVRPDGESTIGLERRSCFHILSAHAVACHAAAAKMDGSKPISGGIPHCFPQFGPGAIQQHGFARNLDWAIVEQSDTQIVLSLSESEYTMAMWPHAFTATYTVSLADDKLATELCVTNTGDSAFDFTAALHSYWSTSAIKNIKITSPDFKGSSYLDKTADPPATVAFPDEALTISKETDSVFAGVSGDVLLEDSGRKRPLTISNKLGWSGALRLRSNRRLRCSHRRPAPPICC